MRHQTGQNSNKSERTKKEHSNTSKKFYSYKLLPKIVSAKWGWSIKGSATENSA